MNQHLCVQSLDFATLGWRLLGSTTVIMLPTIPAYGGTCLPIDSHIQNIVLATKETAVTQHVSHRPIKCQSRSWSERVTTVNGSYNCESPLLKPTGIQFATKPMLETTNGERRKLIGVRTMSLFEYEVQFVLSGVLPVVQNLNCKLQRRLSNVLPNQQVIKCMYSDALANTAVPYQTFTTVLCSYRAGVLKRGCGEAF